MTKFLTRPNVNGANVLLAGDTISIADGSGNTIASATSAPAGTERGLITRPIPSGTQTVATTDVSATGTITATSGLSQNLVADSSAAAANSTVTLALSGQASAWMQLTGTWTAALTLDGSADGGTTWSALNASSWAASSTGPAALALSFSSNSTYVASVGGLTHIRARAFSFTSGTVNVRLSASTAAPPFVYSFISGQRASLTVDSELPAAAALADAAANPTAPTAGAAGLAFNAATWDRVRTLDAYKTAAASPDTGILAIGLAERRFTSVSLGTVVGNTQTWDTEGAASVVVHCGTATTGTFTFEVSADGTNFYAAEVFEATTDRIYTAVNITPAANLVFRCYSAGIRTLRARTVTTLGATVALTATASGFPPRMMTQDTGQGRTLQFASVNITSAATTTIVAASAGLKCKVASYVLITSAAQSVTFVGLSGPFPLAVNAGISAIGQPSAHLMETAVNTAFQITTSVGTQLAGHVSYFLEP